VGNMKAETNGGSSFIAIVDLGNLLCNQRAQMGSLQDADLDLNCTFYCRYPFVTHRLQVILWIVGHGFAYDS